MNYRKYIIATAAVAAVLGFATIAQAGSLENLERERAIMLNTLLSPEFSPEKRQRRITVSRNRLLDLERMALRDKSLVGRNTPMVRAAFDNYDLTFLVHASVENNRAMLDHWLDQIGVSTRSLMNTRVGRR